MLGHALCHAHRLLLLRHLLLGCHHLLYTGLTLLVSHSRLTHGLAAVDFSHHKLRRILSRRFSICISCPSEAFWRTAVY